VTARGGPGNGQRVLRAAGIVAAVVVAALLLRALARDWAHLNQHALLSSLHLDAGPLLAAWLAQTLGWLLMVAAWRSMLGGAGRGVRFTRHLRASAYSALAHIVPGSIWTPVSRVALYRQEGVPAVTVSTALVVEWLLVGLGGLLLYGLAAPLARSAAPGGLAPLLAAGALAVLLLYPANFARVARWAARRLGADASAVASPRAGDLMRWFVAETVVLTLSGLALYALMRGVSPAASLADALAAWGLSMAIANLLAWLPATGIMREGTLVLLLAPLYASSIVALAVVVVWRIWMVLVEVTWAVAAGLLAGRTPARAP
jgi:uncharacterized membrane protein YbhN (UPF0104 family)